MKFPKRQTDISQLAEIMLKGYFSHGDDFPNINRTKLVLEKNKLKNSLKVQLDKRAALSAAIKNKNEKLRILINLMKNCIKKSLVDTRGNPTKMALIGWGPRANPHPKSVPGPPKDLIAEKRNNLLYLIWKKPSNGYEVKCYIVERRIQSKVNQCFGLWQIVGSSIDTDIELENQLKGVNLEYRVVAVNSAGKSMPTNTITVLF